MQCNLEKQGGFGGGLHTFDPRELCDCLGEHSRSPKASGVTPDMPLYILIHLIGAEKCNAI